MQSPISDSENLNKVQTLVFNRFAQRQQDGKKTTAMMVLLAVLKALAVMKRPSKTVGHFETSARFLFCLAILKWPNVTVRSFQNRQMFKVFIITRLS